MFVAFGISPGGLTGTVLGLWGYVGLGLGLLSGLVWLSTNRYLDGTLDRHDGDESNLGTVGAPVVALLADGSRDSAGVRVVWSVLFGEETLPVVDAAAEETNQVDEADVRRIRGYVRRAAQLSVGLAAADLFVRYAPTEAIVVFPASGGETPLPTPDGPSLPGLGVITSFSVTEWMLVFVGVLVVGAGVGLFLAVMIKR